MCVCCVCAVCAVCVLCVCVCVCGVFVCGVCVLCVCAVCVCVCVWCVCVCVCVVCVCGVCVLCVCVCVCVKGNVHHRTGHEGPEGERINSFTFSLTSALDGVSVQRHAPVSLHPGKTRYPLYRRLSALQGRSGPV